jgi:hypothetical protein
MVARSHKKENAMSPSKLFAVALALFAFAGCRESPQIKPANKLPKAVALVADADGKLASKVQLNYTGADIDVTLDATTSSDEDGTIVSYRWLSANAVRDGGLGQLSHDVTTDAATMTIKAGGRYVPPGEPASWPGTSAKVTVPLGEGVWTFILLVFDNKGGVSAPSTVEITIGKPNPADDPKVKMCADNVYSMVSEPCKLCVCNIDDTCRMNIQQDKCDAMCWGLIQCIGSMCPNFAAMAMQTPPDYSCLTANCMAFLSGGTAATAAGPCVTQCTDMCKAGGATPDGGTPAPDGGK